MREKKQQLKRYSYLEKKLNSSFLFFTPIAKVLESEDESNQWRKKEESSDVSDFLGSLSDEKIEGLSKQVTVGLVLNSGYLDINMFLDQSLKYFKTICEVKDESFSFDSFTPSNNPTYKGISYDAVVFCEGFHVYENPYFSFLPFKPVNGDVLTVKIPSYKYNKILNKNFFLLPFHDDTYRLGATYNWQNLSFQPNEDAKKELLKRLGDFVEGEINVIKHEAGVRPSSEDRRPMLGAHPQYKNMHIFNGLGTKGVMLAPYFAKQMCDFLLNEMSLEQEVSISRYYHLQKSL